jgi:anti-anti-sigma factor
MRLKTRKVGEVDVVELAGSLDAASTPTVEERLNKMINSGATKIVIDFKGVDYISSCGLRTLIEAQKRIREKGGDLKLANLNAYAKSVFSTVNFDTLFVMFEYLDDAVRSFSAR